MIPTIDAGVWIEFEAGDASRPIWSGCWWSRNELPKDAGGQAATPALKIIRSEKGLMVTLDDNSQTISLSDEKGKNMLTIQVQQGKIVIQGTSKVVVEAPQIELVENATHPVVFGDQLLQYLNQLVQLYQTPSVRKSVTMPGQGAKESVAGWIKWTRAASTASFAAQTADQPPALAKATTVTNMPALSRIRVCTTSVQTTDDKPP